MNKSDIKLIIASLFICVILFLIFYNPNIPTTATIYYEDKILQNIDLNIDKVYEVKGDLGIVKIEVKKKSVKIIEENSPNHICSKQGSISKGYQSLICLPNKIIVKINNTNNDIDAVIK